jgi:hypothetical protein
MKTLHALRCLSGDLLLELALWLYPQPDKGELARFIVARFLDGLARRA